MVQRCVLSMSISSLNQCIGTTKSVYGLNAHLHLMLLPKIHMTLV